MSFKKIKSVGILFLVLLSFEYAWSACTQVNWVFTQGTTVNLTGNTAPTIPIGVRRNNSNNNGNNHNCEFFIVINNGDPSNNTFTERDIELNGTDTANEYPLQFYTNSARTNIFKSIDQATNNNDVLFGTTNDPNNNNNNTNITTVNYYVFLDPNLYVRDGAYSDIFEARLYRGTIANKSQAVLDRTQNITFTYQQPIKFDVSLVPTSAPFNISDTTETLDFGTIAAGELLGFDIVLKYNDGYSLRMSSANASNNTGRLRRTGSGTGNCGDNCIPYTMRINGSNTPITLSTTLQEKAENTGNGSDISPAPNGLRIPATVTIGAIPTAALPGTYTDQVTISIVSNN